MHTPPAISHTRPESQRPWGGPAPVGQAEPQAKSVGHPPRQNVQAEEKKQLLPLKDRQGGKPGRLRAVLRETMQDPWCVVGQHGSENPQRSRQGARQGSGREHSPCFTDEVSSTVSVMKL